MSILQYLLPQAGGASLHGVLSSWPWDKLPCGSAVWYSAHWKSDRSSLWPPATNLPFILCISASSGASLHHLRFQIYTSIRWWTVDCIKIPSKITSTSTVKISPTLSEDFFITLSKGLWDQLEKRLVTVESRNSQNRRRILFWCSGSPSRTILLTVTLPLHLGIESCRELESYREHLQPRQSDQERVTRPTL